jgi:hypothetical protein
MKNLPRMSDWLLFAVILCLLARARTCDPAVEYLQTFSKMAPEDIVRHMLKVSFDGFR